MRSTVMTGRRSTLNVFGRQHATVITDQPIDRVFEWFKTFDTVITPCDQILWSGDNPIPGSADVMNHFRENGKHIFFCTNNSTKTRSQIREKATKMGYTIKENDIISSSHSTAIYLKKIDFTRTAYLIGSPGFATDLDAAGIKHTPTGPDELKIPWKTYLKTFKPDPDIGAVIVGFDEYFSFLKLMKAVTYLSDPDCLFIVTYDEHYSLPNVTIPGATSITNAILTNIKREPIVIGKPSASTCEHLILERIIVPRRTLMIGKSLDIDVLTGYNCNFQTLLIGCCADKLTNVRTYQLSGDEEKKKLVPDLYLEKLSDLLPYLDRTILETHAQHAAE